MNWLHEFIKNNTYISLLLPTGLSGLSFFGNLFMAISDGSIDGSELHNMMGSASGLQMVILMLVMLALKKPPSKNS